MTVGTKVTASQKWDQRYQLSEPEQSKASRHLQALAPNLRQSGSALDVACGMGGDAVFLAQLGWQVEAIDHSPVAINKLKAFVHKHSLNVHAEVRDLELQDLPTKQYDLITVSYYLSRPLFASLRDRLKKQGCLIYHTWTTEKAAGTGPSNSDFLLQPNELLALCGSLRLMYYDEPGTGEATIMVMRS